MQKSLFKNENKIIYRFQKNPPDQISHAQVSLWNGGSINDCDDSQPLKNDIWEEKIISTIHQMSMIVVDTIRFITKFCSILWES